MKRMRTETRRGIERLIAPLNPRAGHEWSGRAARLILVGWLVAGPGATWVANPQPRATPPNAAGHWAFQPVTAPAVPAVKNKHWPRTPIDFFVLAKLEASRLSPSPEAGRVTLIRRLNFDLLGLPPSPPEIAEFLADNSPDAYEKLVERLLASPHYGERWGRHWLDVAGYADSNGYFSADSERPLAYRYRDYVVTAFNDDQPFDRFIAEQIAGDELAGYSPDGDVTPEMVAPLVATHFLRNAPDGTGESDGNPQELAADRYAVLEGNVQILGSTFLGVTVQCARCHDHKFEPLTQEEYYRLQAILKPAYNHEQWVAPKDRLVTIGARAKREENKRGIETAEREIKTLQASLEGLTKPFRDLAISASLEKLPEADRTAINQALATKEKERSEPMKELLKKHEALVKIKDETLLKQYPELAASYEPLKDALNKHQAARPKPLPKIAALTDVTPQPPPHHLLARGNYTKPLRSVEPGVPAVFCTASNRFVAAPLGKPAATEEGSAPAKPASSGRRLALARWLTSPEHPTVTRLLVNRIWLQHFGQGLVATPENFGLTGAKPTHPELLDWLATSFVRSGWSVKALHRLIVNSATYRQANARREDAFQADPDNRLLWRYPLRRLEAEVVRDTMLAVSGELELQLGGPYTPTKSDADGQVVVDELLPGAHRRSLYLEYRRTLPLTMLDLFDAPQQNPNCTRRNPSTVSLQSLALLNSEFVRARSRAFAARSGKAVAPEQRLAWAFEMAVGRQPNEAERSAANDFFAQQSGHYQNQPDATERAWTDFCQMLFASDAFLYVE